MLVEIPRLRVLKFRRFNFCSEFSRAERKGAKARGRKEFKSP